MRFSLQDIPKSVYRSNGELSIRLSFLQVDELQEEIADLIDYYERAVGSVQRTFVVDEVRASIGDYRLANCLMATLSSWYVWQARTWEQVVVESGGNASLSAFASPIGLRLALYAYVNERQHGFLVGEKREQVLAEFAGQYGIDVERLEYLLAVDSEAEAILIRTSEKVPSCAEVVGRYNQWAFEAALCNASEVSFSIDYRAFSTDDSEEVSGRYNRSATVGIGTVIKRLCYLARVLGVYYDLEYVSGQTGEENSLLKLTLYGPQDVTGLPQQYGLRLARLCRLLLGYGSGIKDGRESGRKRKSTKLTQAVRVAEARVHFSQRSYRFLMDERVLRVLPATQQGQVQESTEIYDSGVEQLFAEAFASSSRSNGTDGWLLEREPEPLLLAQSIFIPDFALTREQKRIYVEILGFWTPAYRERKVQKLQQLRERDDLLLAIPIEAKDAFAAIADAFPIVYYRGQLSATEMLQILREHFDDFAERLQHIDVAQTRELIIERGVLEEQRCFQLLHCYRRSELQEVARRICDGESDIDYLAGCGFYTRSWFERFQAWFEGWLKGMGVVALSVATQQIRENWPEMQEYGDSALELLVVSSAQVRVRHQSLFESTVEYCDESDRGHSNEREDAMVEGSEKGEEGTKVEERKGRSVAKKRTKAARVMADVVQKDLWG